MVRMSTAQSLNDHYRLLLGLDKNWEVERVDLQMEAKRVSIHLLHARGTALSCPQCQNACHFFDHAPERQWRHLDIEEQNGTAKDHPADHANPPQKRPDDAPDEQQKPSEQPTFGLGRHPTPLGWRA